MPAGASRLPSGVDFLACWKGEDAGTSIMLLAGDEDLIGASVGFWRTWVGCVVCGSRRKADGEQGMVSARSSSSMVIVL